MTEWNYATWAQVTGIPVQDWEGPGPMLVEWGELRLRLRALGAAFLDLFRRDLPGGPE